MSIRFAVPFCASLVLVLGACSAAPGESTNGVKGRNSNRGGQGGSRSNGGSGGNPVAGSGGFGGGFGGSSGGSGFAGSGGGDDTPLDPDVCARANVNASRVTPTVSVVIDGSSSMDSPFGNTSRWQALRQALMGDNGLVRELEGIVRFGSVVYGTSNQCPALMQVDPALNNYGAINEQYPNMPPGMYTPTGEALMSVVDRLPDQSNIIDRSVGPQIVILATDGEPNGCGGVDWVSFGLSFIPGVDLGGGAPQIDYGPTREAVNLATSKGIKTYVIAVGEDFNALEELQKVANIGQGLSETADPGAKLHTPQDPSALAQTLRNLVGQSVGCDVTLEGELDVERACEGTVLMNGNELPCEDPNGWEPVDTKTIRINGSACEKWKNDAEALLDAEFPCDVIVIE